METPAAQAVSVQAGYDNARHWQTRLADHREPITVARNFRRLHRLCFTMGTVFFEL